MKEALAALVRWSGLGWGVRFLCARRRATIVVYHDPDPVVLREHLAFYARHYRFTTLDAVADAMETGRWGDLPPYPLVITIDDGHAGNARLAPLLREFGVRPTIYLCSRVVGTARPFWWKTPAASRIGVEELKRQPDTERRRRLAEAGDDPDRDGATRHALTWNEVATLGEAVDYGAHTRTHPILIQCDDLRAAEEIGLSRIELEKASGRPCRHFAYPNGDYGEREVELLRAAGYRTARTIEPGWNGWHTDPLRLKAFPVSDDVSVAWLAVQLTGLPAWLRGLKDSVRGRRTAPEGYPAPSAGAAVPAAPFRQ
ncbi:MAG TPA: polysaccharide deacetylase family protein [Azospirillum sp.]|nr:polysaccharide deacetylase family protein [Azospirillum sp.]